MGHSRSMRAQGEPFHGLSFRRPDMTEWTLLKRLLDAVHQHSTIIGRLWLTVMVVFRLLVVAVATEDVYTDEREMFVCDTLQPGCPNVCYDAFSPISQPRFWVFQIISVSTPSLCFVVYTWHTLAWPSRRLHGPSAFYACHVCFRALLEVGFVVAQWRLFGFRVPAHFVCTAWPCAQRVDCYVSRPTEKTVFLLFMFGVGVFCVLLNFLELNHLGWKAIRRSVGAESAFPDATSSLPTLNLVVDHQPDWTCAGNDEISEAGKAKSKESKARSSEVWI